jgi:hypothetical protein
MGREWLEDWITDGGTSLESESKRGRKKKREEERSRPNLAVGAPERVPP